MTKTGTYQARRSASGTYVLNSFKEQAQNCKWRNALRSRDVANGNSITHTIVCGPSIWFGVSKPRLMQITIVMAGIKTNTICSQCPQRVKVGTIVPQREMRTGRSAPAYLQQSGSHFNNTGFVQLNHIAEMLAPLRRQFRVAISLKPLGMQVQLRFPWPARFQCRQPYIYK